MAAKSAEARWARGLGLQRDVMLAHSRAKLTMFPSNSQGAWIWTAAPFHYILWWCSCLYILLLTSRWSDVSLVLWPRIAGSLRLMA